MYTKRNLVSAILAVAILLLTAIPARPATEAQIEAAINAGVAWLVNEQNDDGSWGSWDQVARTGLAVVKLQDRDRELGTSNYVTEIQDGLDYIFGQATIDPYPPDTGISFAHGGWQETYCTGIAMMAIANDGDLSQVVTGGVLNSKTYEQILEGNVDFFVSSQHANGGWAYKPSDWPDQSNSGYAMLGLGYAKGVGIDTSAVDAGLNDWIDAIQNKTSGHIYEGGSYYTTGGGWENQLKTGNLIFQMTFVGIGPGDSRFDAAIAFIEKYWQDPSQNPGWGYNIDPAGYQAMYCLMKGLEYSGVDLIDTDGVPGLELWHNQDPPAVPAQDLASVLVAQQNPDGSWDGTDWGDTMLCTAWALLTLEKIVPNLPPVADAGDDETVEQASYDGAEVTLDGSGSTDDGLIGPLTYDWTWDGGSAAGVSPTVTFPLGTKTVTLTVDDGEFTDSDTVDITVEDTTDPTITIISVNPEELWPPNHRMVPVIVLIEAEDICTKTDLLEVSVTVTSSEPDDDKGDGAFTGDVDGQDGFTAPVDVLCEFDEEAGCFVSSFALRAERDGRGDGRVYTIEAVCEDASGNIATATETMEVTVAHDQGKGKGKK